ncbi:Helitron helicase [Phytophthora megakarya]|uniref:Helitron helicase n=1 Tax=Phytophthora megakarya TaxID=4795 RepID=A0A225V464_9STRA|nr:Helitron helicase [Phytophthora megakarya]
MNAHSLLIESAGPEYQAAVDEFTRRDRAGEARPEDNPALRLHQFLPEDENFNLRLHVARNSNPGIHNTPTASEVTDIIIDRERATTHCSTIFCPHMVNHDERSTFCILALLTILISGRFRFGSMNPIFSMTAWIPIR